MAIFQPYYKFSLSDIEKVGATTVKKSEKNTKISNF